MASLAKQLQALSSDIGTMPHSSYISIYISSVFEKDIKRLAESLEVLEPIVKTLQSVPLAIINMVNDY